MIYRVDSLTQEWDIIFLLKSIEDMVLNVVLQVSSSMNAFGSNQSIWRFAFINLSSKIRAYPKYVLEIKYHNSIAYNDRSTCRLIVSDRVSMLCTKKLKDKHRQNQIKKMISAPRYTVSEVEKWVFRSASFNCISSFFSSKCTLQWRWIKFFVVF
jgi:hypothetical protein